MGCGNRKGCFWGTLLQEESVGFLCNTHVCCRPRLCNCFSFILFFSALVVRFLTNRFIWEYDPTLGESSVSIVKKSNIFLVLLFCFGFGFFAVVVSCDILSVQSCVCLCVCWNGGWGMGGGVGYRYGCLCVFVCTGC